MMNMMNVFSFSDSTPGISEFLFFFVRISFLMFSPTLTLKNTCPKKPKKTSKVANHFEDQYIRPC